MIVLKTVKKIMQKENGVTLVELLAAIAILSIIVTAFLAFFIQAANTNNRTDDKNEATFYAVEEMEKVTRFSVENQLNEEDLPTADTMKTDLEFVDNVRTTFPEGTNFEVKTVITDPSEKSKLYKVVVTVFEGGKSRAKMESRLLFENE